MNPGQQHIYSPIRDGEQPSTERFRTDDQLAREIRTASRQLRQTANGLHHLEAAIPSLARAVETVIALLERIAELLDPSS